eukprot:1978071-Pyramimonas_sp.AAC.1
MSLNVGRCCRFSQLVELGSSTSLLAVTKVDGLPPAPSRWKLKSNSGAPESSLARKISTDLC